MKFRIFGTTLVLAILGALFVVMQDSDGQHPPQPTAPTTDIGLQPLKIN